MNTTRTENSKAWKAYREAHPESGNDSMALRLLDLEAQTPGYCDMNQREFVGQMFFTLTEDQREAATALGFEAC